jgi:23S rRNA (cytosine1962-C5)-methyltransferase
VDPFDSQFEVEISQSAARRLRQGYLWVYASDVVRDCDEPRAAIVRVLDHGRNPIGYAFYSSKSQIRLRLLTRSERPDEDLIRARVRAAIERRTPERHGGTAQRLIFGEADLLPSVIVDRYGPYLVLQTLSSGADRLKPRLVQILQEILQPAGIVERNDVRARLLEGLDEIQGVLSGDVPELVEIQEHGIRFLVDLRRGQKTGFFLDQSDNRLAAARYARGRALDCFTNTGGFALHFALQCESVTGIDSSSEALARARSNARANGFGHVEFQEANVFDYLRNMDAAAGRFQTICLDPPAFAKNRRALPSAIGGYKEINLRAMKLLEPDGVLVTSSCSYHLTEDTFFELLVQASRDAHRYVQVIEKRSQAADHPMLAGMPETHYLKCFILRVL